MSTVARPEPCSTLSGSAVPDMPHLFRAWFLQRRQRLSIRCGTGANHVLALNQINVRQPQRFKLSSTLRVTRSAEKSKSLSSAP